jgi:cytochrome c biogenesis protein CcmG, thiol:disulfide interchange protein DsbE
MGSTPPLDSFEEAQFRGIRMKKETLIKLIVLAGVMAVFIFFALSLRQQSADVAGVGETAFNFEMEDLDGKMQKLSDYKGQVVILNYFATWCSPCVEEAPELEAFEKEYGDQFKLLIIDRGETRDRVKKYVAQYKTTSTYLFDYNHKISKKYNVVAQPETFVIDQTGTIREHHIGPISKTDLYTLASKYQ